MTSKIFDISKKIAPLRYWILLAVSCIYLGVYWTYDLPSALSIQLQNYLALNVSQYTYLLSSLYVSFAVPSIILPFFSGFVIQKYGSRLLLLCCLTVTVSGQLVFCIALQVKSTAGLVIARVLLGIGGEVLGVLGTEVVTRWFPGDKTGLAMAIYTSISSLGTVANSNVTPRLTTAYDALIATWISSILALGLTALSTLFVITVDITEEVKTEDKNNERFIESICRLPRSYWYLACICLTGYGCLLPFFNSAQRFISSRFYADNQTIAGLAVSIVHVVGGVMAMFFGLLLEIPVLRNFSLALFYSQVLMLVPHVIFLVDYGGPLLPLSMLGIGNALFSAGLWASVSISILQTQGPVGVSLELESLMMEDQEIALQVESGEAKVNSPILEAREWTLDSESLLDISSNQPLEEKEIYGNDLVIIGYGIITSLMGISTVAIPFLLAPVEGWAGFLGLEIVFVVIASIGVLISLGLIIKEEKLQ